MGAWGTAGWMVAAALAAALVAGWWRWRRILGDLERGLEAAPGQWGEGDSLPPRRRGAAGRLARRMGAALTELEERRAALGRDLGRVRAVLDGMGEAVVAVDPRRRVLLANAAADRLFSLGERAVGRLVAELIRHPPVLEAVDQVLGGSGTFRGEITLGGSGREVLGPAAARILDVRGGRLPGPPPAGAVLVFHDVTELRRLERMRQDFVANVSHELKTPLAAIKAYTETLLDWALTDEAVNVRFLRQIEEQADRLDRLVLDLLSLARLESGQEVFRHDPLPLAPVVQACAETHRGRAEARELTYDLDLGGLGDATEVRADEEAVRQILDNLIDNALKYTPEGGRVAVSCRVEDGFVAVEVADTGLGIPREDLPRIFERFYRVDKARSRELGGTGLGLAIVKHLVQSLGGRVEVTSRVGAGSRFRVLLPRVAPEAEKTAGGPGGFTQSS